MQKLSPSNFLDLTNEIINIRRFTNQEVENKDLDLVLSAFRNGPSTANQQPWEVLILSNEQKEKLVMATLDPFYKSGNLPGQPWIKEAPVVLLITLEDRRTKARIGDLGISVNQQDTFAAIQNLRLMAALIGLSSATVREFDSEKVVELLQIPHNFRPLAIVAIGFGAEGKEYPPRLAMNDFVHKGEMS